MKALSLLLCALVACAYPHPNYAREAESIQPIQYKPDSGPYCTAFHVRGDFWATAKHCVDNGPMYVNGHAARLVEAHPDKDVALIEALGSGGVPVLDLGNEAAFGDEVHYIGYGQTRDGYTHDVPFVGIVGRPDPWDGGVVEVGLHADGGASGSPMMDREGRVVGVLVGGYNEPYTYFVPVKYVREMLDRA